MCPHIYNESTILCLYYLFFKLFFLCLHITQYMYIEYLALPMSTFHALNVKYLLHRVLKYKESLLFVLHAYIYSDVFYVYISLILLCYLIYSKTTGTVKLHAYINWSMYTCIFFCLHLKYILACKCIYYVAK